MARGPDGAGGQGALVRDQLFNHSTLAQLAAEHSVLPGFDAQRFLDEALPGLAGRGLMARLDWVATCLERQLPQPFPAMAEALTAAMPPELDPTLRDGDFGRYIHAVPGVLAVRHGLQAHPDRALDLLHAATRRFSMEFALRPFLNHWPDLVLDRLAHWAQDPHYHVRRLVSEGTRPRLPWGQGITLDPRAPLPLLDLLHADPARFVTRSVANHLNDLTRVDPGLVTARLRHWQAQASQTSAELDWMRRHALRSAIKRGDPQAMAHLGHDPALPVTAQLHMPAADLRWGEPLAFAVTLTSAQGGAALVDYRISFAGPRPRKRVFKLAKVGLQADQPARLDKTHPLKPDASTLPLSPGAHVLTVQVNGVDRAEAQFTLLPPA